MGLAQTARRGMPTLPMPPILSAGPIIRKGSTNPPSINFRRLCGSTKNGGPDRRGPPLPPWPRLPEGEPEYARARATGESREAQAAIRRRAQSVVRAARLIGTLPTSRASLQPNEKTPPAAGFCTFCEPILRFQLATDHSGQTDQPSSKQAQRTRLRHHDVRISARDRSCCR